MSIKNVGKWKERKLLESIEIYSIQFKHTNFMQSFDLKKKVVNANLFKVNSKILGWGDPRCKHENLNKCNYVKKYYVVCWK